MFYPFHHGWHDDYDQNRRDMERRYGIGNNRSDSEFVSNLFYYFLYFPIEKSLQIIFVFLFVNAVVIFYFIAALYHVFFSPILKLISKLGEWRDKVVDYFFSPFVGVASFTGDFISIGSGFEGSRTHIIAKRQDTVSEVDLEDSDCCEIAGDTETMLIKRNEPINEILKKYANSDTSNMDYRIDKIFKSIRNTTDLIRCFNDVSGDKYSNSKISASVMKDYVDFILGGYMKKTWVWNKRYECVAYILLNDFISRNEFRQEKRNRVSREFLINEFTEVCESFSVSQSLLWSITGISDCVDKIVTLLEFDVITPKEGAKILKRIYSSKINFQKDFLVNCIFKLSDIIEYNKEDEIKELDFVTKKIILEERETALNILKERNGHLTGLIHLVKMTKAAKSLTGGKYGLKDIKCSIYRVIDKLGEDGLLNKKSIKYVDWNDNARLICWDKNFGNGPFEVLSEPNKGSYVIQTNKGTIAFGCYYLDEVDEPVVGIS